MSSMIKQAAIDATTDRETAETMHQYGGSFVKMLAQAWLVADPMNQARVKEAFRPEFDRYRADAAALKHYRSMAHDAELASRN
ncbi:hypothetical protein [Achromobacter sp. NFACC18-2]|uniref:hypothetical protein n=1 Tax=Achromobacter sp. NFACC18-2 TaxID=1564112 RepID=UPI0008AE0EC2|nr:hypothetical protein [Achromobacter sp. NFACC18-2]SEJ99761.1 hypothetical protein SAMN03159494_04234 [Achromobacter sp. NFACC18-2]